MAIALDDRSPVTAPTIHKSRVPAITPDFWAIKLLAVTVGETFADFMNFDLGLGLSKTSWFLGATLAGTLIVQFAKARYLPWVYWLNVVLISVVGTLITDNLVEVFGVSLMACTIAFSAALALTFWLWQRSEGTLSIHTIVTAGREAWYWLAILFTFALGTAAGDLVAETFGLGYLQTGLMFAAVIAAITFGHFVMGMNAVLAFWLAYILTRPLGASFGDLLSQPLANGGLGFGTVVTSFLFLGAIAAIVTSLTRRHRGYEADVTF